MTKRYNLVVLSVALLLSIAVWIATTKKVRAGKSKDISAKIFEGFCGWGYDILVDDSLFIHQESIPAISGNRGFLKKQQAEKVALLIINKMKAGRLPTITTFELQQIGALEEIQYGGQRKP